MTDEFSGGSSPSEAPSPGSPPSESFGHPVDVASDPVINERRHAVLDQLSRTEDISNYAAERRDQSEVMDKGKAIPEERQRQWYRRASRALQDASLEAQGIQPNGQQPQPQQQYSDQSYQDPSEALDYMRKQGAAAERINQYYGADKERRQAVVDWGVAMDPDHHVAQWLIENESTVAPQILERLTANPEAWRQLAELPANQRDRWLGALEGHLTAEANFQRQMAAQVQKWDEAAGRKISRAPPPISKMPAGGAGIPKDAHALARSEDVSSYVALRKAQDRRARE